MANRWRVLLLALCAVVLGLNIFELSLPQYSSGFLLASAGSPYLERVSLVVPGSAAAGKGLRVGDILDIRPMTAADRYRMYNHKHPGDLIRVYLDRSGHLTPLTIGAHAEAVLTWDVLVAIAACLWMLLFAAILAIRRPDSREARVLALLLIGLNYWAVLLPINWVSPWPLLDAVLAAVSAAAFLSFALLATYSLSFGSPSRLRQTFAWLAYAAASVAAVNGVLQAIAQWTGVLHPTAIPTQFAATIAFPATFGFSLLCGVATVFETREAERSRFLWAFGPMSLLYLTMCVDKIPGFVGSDFNYTPVENVIAFFAPIGLTYSLLSRRLLDVGFALNRAVVFSGVSIVLVGTFVLIEWAISDWLQHESHSTNLLISGALALLLGLSIRFVHTKVEHVVDHVMFRKRREDEEAIRKMAREAPYITDRATLLARAERVLLQHADASSARFLLDDGNGRYDAIEENDPALVSMRTDHARVDLHALDTAINGEWAYPMVARGRLVGALVLGPKRSQESYAPDESAAIAHLAHSVAGALDVLSTHAPGDALDGIRASLEALTIATAQMPAAIARELRAAAGEPR